MALKRLQKEYKQYLEDVNNLYSIEVDDRNFYKWNILIFGPLETIFEGGIFKCIIEFPKTYPNAPPVFKFKTIFPHPNIYPDGNICISILHPGQDEFNYERMSERWTPSHSVNSIIMSIISLLTTPNFESAANIDASLLWQKSYEEYKKQIYKIVAETQKNLI